MSLMPSAAALRPLGTAIAPRGADAAPAGLEVRGLTVAHDGVTAVEDLSAAFPAGSLSAVVGPNGAGKSSLLRGVLGIDAPVAGSVRVLGRPLAEVRARVAYVPQRAAVDWEFPARVEDVVAMGLWAELGLFRRYRAAHRARVLEALARVGMADLAGRQIGRLSGGQRQRAFMARALVQGADLYLLDEPFAGVDASTEAAIFGVLRDLRDAGATVVCVHHDLGTVAQRFDRALVMNRRKLAEGPVAEAMAPAALQAAYGGRLELAAPPPGA